ncbi:MAG TPA: hypothetical protein EYG85_10010 [Crocinitomix sp.]|nr:hypothetical protein [Crocinitomix sp.]
MQKLTILIFIFISTLSFAQVPNQIGARANGLANSTRLINDVWSVKNNPGALGQVSTTGVGIAYQSRFLVNELANQSFVFNYHLNDKNNLGIFFQQTGFSLYRQIQTGLAYGMKLSNNLSAGISLNFHRVAFGDVYGAVNAVSASVGLMYSLNDNLDLGVNVQNINRAKLDDYQDERFPTLFNVGLKYKFNEGTFWSIEAEKDILQPLNIKSGIEILTHKIFVVRFGMNSYPFLASFGAGIKLNKFQFNIASSWHSTLGLSPSMSLNYKF